MTYGPVILWGLVIVAGWFLISQFTRTPRRTAVFLMQSATFGFALMAAINVSASVTHVHVPFNSFTALATGLLGVPGVLVVTAVHLIVL